jgi:arylsulfatase A-like enzyme
MPRATRPLLLLAAALAAAPAPPCAGDPAAPPPDIVLVAVDSLRAGHLGCYGYGRPTSPAIDAFAAAAVRYAFACPSSSWTQPSVMSLFTSLPPEAHGRTGPGSRHDPDAPTLAGELAALGYETAAVTANPMVHRRYGFARGFSHYDDYTVFMDVGGDVSKAAGKNSMDPLVTRLAIARLARRDPSKPLFLFVLYMDPHWDYIPRHPHDAAFGVEGYASPPITALNGKGVAPAEGDRIVRAYDAEIRGTDDAFAGLLRAIGESPSAGRTAVVLCADHGESFWDRRDFTGHGNDLYDEELHVPLVIRPPEGTPFVPGLAVTGQVALVDLAPTLLRLAGGVPPASWTGRDLSGSFLSGVAPTAPAVLDTSISGRHRRGVRDGRWKLLADPPFDAPSEAYDLLADPGERTNLAGALPPEAARLVPLLKPAVRPGAGGPEETLP